jgi:hypothetical protein
MPVASALLLGHRLVQAPQSVVMMFAIPGPHLALRTLVLTNRRG